MFPNRDQLSPPDCLIDSTSGHSSGRVGCQETWGIILDPPRGKHGLRRQGSISHQEAGKQYLLFVDSNFVGSLWGFREEPSSQPTFRTQFDPSNIPRTPSSSSRWSGRRSYRGDSQKVPSLGDREGNIPFPIRTLALHQGVCIEFCCHLALCQGGRTPALGSSNRAKQLSPVECDLGG